MTGPEQNGDQPLIALESVGKRYQLGAQYVDALSSLSLKIDRGGIVGLMGPSGSGKSTLLNLIGALDKPTTGRVLVHGTDIALMERDEQATFRNKTIGFVFQNFNLIPVLTTLENVLLPAELGRLTLAEPLRDRALGLLESVGLKAQAPQSVNRLSGGQMQRAAIARALMNQPPIILADEPTANLDQGTADTVLAVLRDVCAKEGATVIVATHDQRVLNFCRRIVRLTDGRLTSDDSQSP